MKEIKTYKQILKENFGINLEESGSQFHNDFVSDLIEASKIHALQFIEAAAEKAEVKNINVLNGKYDPEFIVNKESILKLKEEVK